MFEDLRLIGVQGNQSSSSFAHRCHGSDSFFLRVLLCMPCLYQQLS